MTREYLEAATEELEKASDEATDHEVEQQLQERADELARLAERRNTDYEELLDRHQSELRSVSVDAGGAVENHVVEANKQLSKLRSSLGT